MSCWETLACGHPLPKARLFQSLVSILVLAQPAWLAWLGLGLLGLEPMHPSWALILACTCPMASLGSVDTDLKSLSWPLAPSLSSCHSALTT